MMLDEDNPMSRAPLERETIDWKRWRIGLLVVLAIVVACLIDFGVLWLDAREYSEVECVPAHTRGIVSQEISPASYSVMGAGFDVTTKSIDSISGRQRTDSYYVYIERTLADGQWIYKAGPIKNGW